MAQLLVKVVSVTNLAPGATISVLHDLESNDVAVAPTLVLADRSTSIIVQSVTDTQVTFLNTGLVNATANFRCERGWQPEVDASTVTSMLWQGGGGAGSAGAVTKLFTLVTPNLNFADNTSGAQAFTNGQVTIPANSLTTTSTFRIRVGTLLKQAGAGTVSFIFTLGGATTVLTIPATAFSNNTAATFDVTFGNRGIGTVIATYASATGWCSNAQVNTVSTAGANLNTTVSNVLTMSVNFSAAAAGTNIDIVDYEVYLAR
jgi:hypothetical protein